MGCRLTIMALTPVVGTSALLLLLLLLQWRSILHKTSKQTSMRSGRLFASDGLAATIGHSFVDFWGNNLISDSCSIYAHRTVQ